VFPSDHSDIRKFHKERDAHPGLSDEASAEQWARDRELSAIYENVAGILFYVSVEPDGNFRFLSMSKAGLAAMGLTREEVVGSLVRDVVPLPSRDMVLNNYREAIRSGQTVRWREESVYPAGRKIGEVAVTPLYDANGIATNLVGIVHDITEREQLEELLQMQRDEEHNHALKLLLETATQGIVSIDGNGNIVTANYAFETMFGWPRAELIGQSIEVLMPSALRHRHQQHRMNYFASPRARLMGGGLTLVGERRDGSTFPIEVSLNHVSSPVGELAFAFVTDVSERKRMEEALSNVSEKLIRAQEQERARIGRELHDDISQRLALLSVSLCELEDDPSEAQKRLKALQKDLVEVSQDVQALSHELHSSKLEYLGVVAGIRSWCKEFGDWQKIDILFESDVLRALPFDIGLCLFRILQEALHNAAKHSAAKRISVQLREDSGAIYLAVNDSGRGFDINAAALGRGVGLASMQERVRLVNGTIAIDSKPMGGTTIHVRVPLHSEHQTSQSA
jgi:PAS domain S-box-containing protein